MALILPDENKMSRQGIEEPLALSPEPLALRREPY
jgi:hypothetical protein